MTTRKKKVGPRRKKLQSSKALAASNRNLNKARLVAQYAAAVVGGTGNAAKVVSASVRSKNKSAVKHALIGKRRK